eukprot:9944823-Lingulodinium_polyedra.AAC.1
MVFDTSELANSKYSSARSCQLRSSGKLPASESSASSAMLSPTWQAAQSNNESNNRYADAESTDAWS